MKHILIILFSIGMITTAHASETIRRTVSVTGSAEIQVVPDEVLILMASKTRSNNLLEAQSKNNKTVESLLNYLLNDLGVLPKNVQMNLFTLTPEYHQCTQGRSLSKPCDPSKVEYYNVEKGIAIKLQALENYEKVIAKSLDLGITHITDVQFTTTQLRKHKDDARQRATLAAKEKAKDAANALGMSLGKPVSINLDSASSHYQLYQSNVVSSGNSDFTDTTSNASTAFGQISVNANVSVTFEIQDL